jgi:hypothetical protein
MADVLGSIFGSGQRATQTQRPDPLAQEFNALRLGLTGQIFNQVGMDQFAAERPDIYRPSDRSEYLWQSASRALDDAGNVDTGQFMSFDDYMNRGYDATDRSYRTALESTSDAYEMGRGINRAALDTARGNLRGTFDAGRGINRAALDTGIQTTGAGYNTARGNVAAERDRALGDIYGGYNVGLNQANVSGERALGRLDTAFDTSYDRALGQTEGYINQIATPAAMQAATLQGLEGGGAVPAAIARATAEYGGSLLGPLLQQYMSGTTGIAGAQQQQEGALSSELLSGLTGIGNTALGAEAALGQDYLGSLAGLSGQYMGQEGQLLNQLLSAEAGLGGQYLGQEGSLGQGYLSSITGLGGQYMNNLGQFVGSLPGASTQLGLAPFQARQMATDTALTRANAAMSLFPMADFGRSLQEQDFLRRQGLAQTALTGIPFTPGSSTSQRQSSQPLFNFLGQG